MQRNHSTGYVFALGASVALASSFVFSKSVLNHLTMIQFGLFWFALGVIWNGCWFIFQRDYRSLSDQFSKKSGVALIIATLEGMATGLFYFAIQAMENPAVVSFIGNIGPVFVVIMGIFLLKERFKSWQITGIFITLGGVFLISYKQGGMEGFLDPGSTFVILASFLFSVATIVGRRYHALLVPGYMSLVRSLLLAATFLIIFLVLDQELPAGNKIWRDLTIGSILETLITIIFAYQALKLIEATKTSLIISSKGVWTLVLAWIFLGVFPSNLQLTGGILTLIGVWLITRDKPINQRG